MKLTKLWMVRRIKDSLITSITNVVYRIWKSPTFKRVNVGLAAGMVNHSRQPITKILIKRLNVGLAVGIVNQSRQPITKLLIKRVNV